MNNQKTVFISGATSGIGFSTAKTLIDNGYNVIAACYPSIEGGEKLKSYASDKITLISLNVADNVSVTAMAKQVHDMVSEQGLSGLVNCAGIAILSPVEHLSIDEFQRVIDINVVGTFAVTKALLPLLRKAKGTVVNISSDAGILAMPSGAAYCASKFAVEAFSDALRAEVRAQGIKVAIVEPGNINTPMWELLRAPIQAKYDALDGEHQKIYGSLFRGLLAVEQQGIPVDWVGQKISHIIASNNPKARYRIGQDAHISKLISFLPTRLKDWLALKVLESYASK